MTNAMSATAVGEESGHASAEKQRDRPMKQSTKQSTKQCPNCGNTYLILLRSLNLKYCVDCNTEIPWYLEEGQESL